MRKKLLSTILIATMIFTGCGAKSPDGGVVPVTSNNSEKVYNVSSVTVDDSENDKTGETEVTEAAVRVEEETSTVTDDAFESWGYIYESSGSTDYYIIVKNNSTEAVKVSGYAVAKDSEGNILDDSSTSISVLGHGETTIANFLFYGIVNVDSVEYELSYDTNPNYYPVLGDLDIEYTVNRSNVSMSVTNNGNYSAEFVCATCLFFDEYDNVVDTEYGYLPTVLGLYPGQTVYNSISLLYTKDFVRAEVYFDGSGVDMKDVLPDVSDDDFDVKVYGNSYAFGGPYTEYYLAITNNSPETVSIYATGAVRDSQGNFIDASYMSDIDVLGTGETSVVRTSLDGMIGDDIEELEYALLYGKEDYYLPVVGGLTYDTVKQDDSVILSVTNNGEIPAQFVQATVIFINGDGEVVKGEKKFIMDEDCEIKPGETLSREIWCGKEFDRVEVYFNGRGETNTP